MVCNLSKVHSMQTDIQYICDIKIPSDWMIRKMIIKRRVEELEMNDETLDLAMRPGAFPSAAFADPVVMSSVSVCIFFS